MLDTAEVLSLTASSSDKVAGAVAQGTHSIEQLQQLCTEVTCSADTCCLLWLLNRATKLTILVASYGRSSMDNLLNRQLRPAKNVSAMKIMLYSECRYEDMRKDMLQGIEHLGRVLFDGGDVVLYLPANIKWEVAIFEGGKIALEFEDVTKFVRTGDIQYNTGPSVYEDESAEGEDEGEDYDYDEDEEDGMWGHGNHYAYGVRDSDDEYYYN
ncbi:hypothetical protein COCSUDRAFT_60175 [Coccomyxa subellipsoidea C-169]|uniref:Uncharacterized protein n=1 Tax=Coccomyxa subellipsoidea (strain C-169) TaxID=574566 RepID=I0YJD9_COCSC|nr:hypothetical protein COCSUDRAFT_60175 [Coccomyxa subellipsoidea C-169]EIE18508.1 hypothetical protein COCSUDRAFT_60175 [Coccomyxa subellipsoidea C-169]|eukprot:XP_005643052.1 hypothetical protein COCSUDRAFT_60175 [Coccomyxa subellipsoidea C-169]